MPTCHKCKTTFRNRIRINGELKNVSKRKFCLDCSPYKAHNTRDLTKDIGESRFGESRYCPRCKETKNASEFYRRRNGTGLSSYCIKCSNKESGDRLRRIKQFSIEYLGGKCAICGYDICHAALHFHHIDPSQKNFAISTHRCFKFESLKAELDKCILVCANCHYEIESGIIATPTNISRHPHPDSNGD